MSTRSVVLIAAVAAAGLGPVGCDRGVELDTRTFQLENVESGEILGLIEPYVYEDRPGAPGMISRQERALSVRETPDNLEKIARVLEEYDVPSPLVRLRFQLIRADGGTETDPAIAEVVTELRSLFQYEGYELLGEAVITARGRSEVRQAFSGTDETFGLNVRIGSVRSSTIPLEEVTLFGPGMAGELVTAINVSPGQTLVLGSSRAAGGEGAIILTVRGDLAES